jgi:hypothetical protein
VPRLVRLRCRCLAAVAWLGGAHNDALMVGLVVAGPALVTQGAPPDPAGPASAFRRVGSLGPAGLVGS